MRLDLWGAVEGANNAIVYTEGKAVAEFVQLSKCGKLVSTMTVSHAFIDRYNTSPFWGCPYGNEERISSIAHVGRSGGELHVETCATTTMVRRNTDDPFRIASNGLEVGYGCLDSLNPLGIS